MKTMIKNFNTAALLMSVLLSIPAVFAKGQDLRNLENNSFQKGEKLKYRAYYDSFLPGYITVADASLEIRESNATIKGRRAMHVIGEAKTRRFFNLFFRVNNRYETYIDEEAIAPWHFMRDIYEGGYERQENISFNQFDNIAYTEGKKINTPDYVQDIISAFYFARTLDFSDIQPGDEFEIDFLFKDSVYVTKIKFEGREKVKTQVGTFNTMKFKPMVLTGSVFKQPYPMTLWVSDDKNRIPVMLQSGVVVGNVKLELTEYHGLKNPVTALAD